MKILAFIRSAGILGAVLFASAISATALEPNDLWPGMSKAAAVSVYTSHRSCGNYEFRDEPQGIGWDASLYGRPASVEIQFEDNAATSILIVLFMEAEDDEYSFFKALVEERIRDLGNPFPASLFSDNTGSGGLLSGGADSNSSDSTMPDTMAWSKNDHLIRLERWPVAPPGEIHITRIFPR